VLKALRGVGGAAVVAVSTRTVASLCGLLSLSLYTTILSLEPLTWEACELLRDVRFESAGAERLVVVFMREYENATAGRSPGNDSSFGLTCSCKRVSARSTVLIGAGAKLPFPQAEVRPYL
jgi:hypothetical protein